MSFESLDKKIEAEKNYEKTVEEEKTFANHIAWTFWYEGPIAGAKNLRNRLTAEEIIEADARRMDELKSKNKLNNNEKAELEWRERGDLFYQKRNKKRALPNWGGFMAGGIKKSDSVETMSGLENLYHDIKGDSDTYEDVERVTESVFKEVVEEIETIEGVIDGQKVRLERSHYDLSEDELSELNGTEAGRNKIKYFRQHHYSGEIGEKELKPKEAERLFTIYFPFAQKRSEEINALRAKKE